MKKLLNTCLLLTSLIGYLEWGKGQHSFLGQVEYDMIFGVKQHSENFMHPFVLLPLLGQLLLLITLFQKTPTRILTLTGILCLGTIMLMILVVGSLSLNIRIIASALPYTILAIIALVKNFKRKRSAT